MASQSAPQNAQKAQHDKAPSRTKQSNGAPAFDLGGDLQRALQDVNKAQPNDILQLQRAAGNRAVSSIVQQRTQTGTIQPKLMVGPANDRYEREADETASRVMRMQTPAVARRRSDEETAQRQSLPGQLVQREGKSSADGFAADKNFTRQLSASKSGGKSLPSDTRSFMESRFNADFGGVRVHTGDSASQLNHDIQAKAFTHGSNIYFNQGAYSPGSNSGKELLAHELTHVVQQGAAVQRTATESAPTIQRKPQGVIQRSLGSWIKGKFSKKKDDKADKGATASSGGTKTATPPTSTAPTKKPLQVDPTNVAPTDESRDDAATFEQKLGRVAYNHSKANSAAKTMMDKMTKSMIGDLEEDNREQEKEIVKLYGRDKASSAGQVGTTVEAVLGVLKGGNLRERMTALMNAMFGPFKDYVKDAMKKSAWGEMADKGLNVEKLKRRKRQMKWNIGAKDLFRDPGNPLDRKNFSTFQRTGNTRFDKNDPTQQTSERTVSDLEKGPYSVGLSEREKALQFPGKKDDEIANEKLKWMEGGTYWAVNHKNKWVKNVEQTLHMPILAGPSGTMLRMFQTWEYLNKPVSAEDWRLAVLGWMLSANDHSFHEMMLTAADYGLPYTPGPQAYMNVSPLSVQELRQHVAEGGLFPHELAMMRKVQGGDITHLMEDDDLDEGTKAAKKFAKGKKPEDKGSLSGPGAAAIDLYTRFGYLVLNPTRKGGKFASQQITRNAKNKDEMSDFKDDFESGKLTAEDLMKEARDIIPVLDTALDTLPDWKGELFRGTGTFSPFSYRKGSTVKFGAYTSSTLDEDVAKGFADDYNIGPFKYILHLDTIAGKDVRDLSAANEDEILIPPGSVFSVTKRIPPDKGRAYYHVYLTQTARGGGNLKLTPDKDSLINSGGIKVDDKPTTVAPKALYEIVLDKYITAEDENGKSVGNIRPGETIGITGVTKGKQVQYIWGDQTYWMGDAWWVMYFETPYPQAGKDIDMSTIMGGKTDDSGGIAPVDVSPPKPKMENLTLYLNDKPVDALSSPDDIAMDDISFYTDGEGVEWVEISTLIGGIYWTKKAELFAFQGKDYVDPSKTTVTPTIVGSSSKDSSGPPPKTGEVSSDSVDVPVSSGPIDSGVVTIDELDLYDSDNQKVDTMHSVGDIHDDDFSTMIDENGVEWKEIVSKGSGFYWVKASELAAFQGKPYKSKGSK